MTTQCDKPGRTDRTVFGVAAALTLAFVTWGIVGTSSLSSVSKSTLGWVIDKLGWAFVVSASGFVVFVLWLALSRYGRVPLGKDGEKPEFGTVSWVAMMFSAGMSAVSGVARGIQWLSNTNMVLAVVLAVFLFVVGPTVFVLNLVPSSVGAYLSSFGEMAGRTAASGGDATSEWLSGWTVFYWAWWISWTPFVGTFIARISRGRTIRQFVGGVILVPSAVSLVWFAILGGTAIFEQRSGVDIAGNATPESQLFALLDQFPLAAVTGVLVMVLVAIFFVSGADAASVVMGTLSQSGSIRPTRPVVIFWGVLTGAVAAVMLLVGGATALQGLQNLTIIAALPFLAVMIGLCVSLARDLRAETQPAKEVGLEQVEVG